jgi:hypothetical protein
MTSIEFEQDLTPFKNGANVHTINKTICYHKSALNQNRPDFAEMLEKLAHAAKTTGDWKPLQDRLANYW